MRPLMGEGRKEPYDDLHHARESLALRLTRPPCMSITIWQETRPKCLLACFLCHFIFGQDIYAMRRAYIRSVFSRNELGWVHEATKALVVRPKGDRQWLDVSHHGTSKRERSTAPSNPY